IKIDDRGVRQPTVCRTTAAFALKRDDVTGIDVTVLEEQSVHDKIFAGDLKSRLAGKDHFPRRLGAKCDRPILLAFGAEDDARVFPHAIGHDDWVPGQPGGVGQPSASENAVPFRALEAPYNTTPIPNIVTPQNANASRPITGFGIAISKRIKPP